MKLKLNELNTKHSEQCLALRKRSMHYIRELTELSCNVFQCVLLDVGFPAIIQHTAKLYTVSTLLK